MRADEANQLSKQASTPNEFLLKTVFVWIRAEAQKKQTQLMLPDTDEYRNLIAVLQANGYGVYHSSHRDETAIIVDWSDHKITKLKTP
jgi:hypothetical protein